MTFDEAKKLLESCKRDSLVDRAFGDAEIYWMKDGKQVAEGYFGRDISRVSLGGTVFEDKEAKDLRYVGQTGTREFNDAGSQSDY